MENQAEAAVREGGLETASTAGPEAESGGREGSGVKIVAENEAPSLEIKRAKFPALRPEKTPDPLGKIDYLKDVDLEASVELGSAVVNVEKVLGLGVSSIIELNQTVGDPVRILINGHAFAYGEVVVINEKFGVRITKVLHEE